MKSISHLLKKLHGLHKLSKISIRLGLALACTMYVVALLAWLYTPHAGDYLYVLSVQRGALEAAPACLAVGVCAGLLGDLMLRKTGR